MRESVSDGSYTSGGPELSLVFGNANVPKHDDLLTALDFPRALICLSLFDFNQKIKAFPTS